MPDTIDPFSLLTLLYIEDESSIRTNAVEYFGRMFHNVLEASNGMEGYRLYERYKPDIIITDIKMPMMSGLELTRKIRRLDRTTPVIVLSAFMDTPLLLEAVELNLVKYLIKPFNEHAIREALSAAICALNRHSSIFHLDADTVYDTFNKTLLLKGEPVRLTRFELLLLDLLVKHHPRTVAYEEIQHVIWPEDGLNINSLRTIVKSLRKKLHRDVIENISGFGYKVSGK
jgi:DNA-binding response OmpR family regulator